MVERSNSSSFFNGKPAALWISIAVVTLLLVAGIFLGAGWLKQRMAGTNFTTDTTNRQFVVGNDVLSIPLNLMRFPAQREAAAPQSVELAMAWPSGEGFTEKNQLLFHRAESVDRLIFITLAKRSMPQDMTGRLESIYMKLFDGKSTAGPAGLRLQALKRGSGYDDEQLAINVEDGNMWVARCQNTDASTRPTCLHDLHIGKELSVRYRFSRSLLNDWRKVDKLVLYRVKNLLVQ